MMNGQPDPTAYLAAAEALRLAMQQAPARPRTAQMQSALAIGRQQPARNDANGQALDSSAPYASATKSTD